MMDTSSVQQLTTLVQQRLSESWQSLMVTFQLPSLSHYQSLVIQAVRDTHQASQSVLELMLVSFRPFTILLYMIFRGLWWLTTKYILRGLLVSCQHGLEQLHSATLFLIKWQRTRTREFCLMEVGVLCGLGLLYLLRRHIQRRAYVTRIANWYRRKQQRVVQTYTRTLYKVEQTSSFLAMCVPHAVFFVVVFVVKQTVPHLVTYLANGTYLVFLLSIGYPLLCTIALVHWYRQEQQQQQVDQPETNQILQTPKDSLKKKKKSKKPTDTSPSSSTTTPHRNNTPKRRRRRSSFFPRTTPHKQLQQWIQQQASPNKHDSSSEPDDYNLKADVEYWLSYWMILALLHAFLEILKSIPLLSRWFLSRWEETLAEVQFIFIVWIFVLPSLVTSQDYSAHPLDLLYHKAAPLVSAVGRTVSHAIPPPWWDYLLNKTKSILEVFVLVRMIQDDTKTTWLDRLEHSHAFLLPALSLAMPGALTRHGLLYVQALVPSWRTVQALQDDNNKARTSATPLTADLDTHMLWLQYWVLHTLWSGLISWWAPILWWIPFSTHVLFVTWCHLCFPDTIQKWYDLLEVELQAFGLLPEGEGESEEQKKSLDQTVTATVLRRLARSLPSGVDDDETTNGKEEAATAVAGHNHDPMEEASKDDATFDDDVQMTKDEDLGTPQRDSDSSFECNNDDYGEAENQENRSNVTTLRRRSTRQRKQRI